jgi:hypothetical protein
MKSRRQEPWSKGSWAQICHKTSRKIGLKKLRLQKYMLFDLKRFVIELKERAWGKVLFHTVGNCLWRSCGRNIPRGSKLHRALKLLSSRYWAFERQKFDLPCIRSWNLPSMDPWSRKVKQGRLRWRKILQFHMKIASLRSDWNDSDRCGRSVYGEIVDY